jgi:hypothetical protein
VIGAAFLAAAIAALHASGGVVHLPRAATAGYDVAFAYAASDAQPGSTFSLFYVRRPTPSEMLPYPPPPPQWGGPDAVFFLSFTVAAPAPVHFQAGSTLDVACPFPLDDSIVYFFDAVSSAGEITSRPVTSQKSTLRFVLPAFTAKPGEEIMGEADAQY